MLTFTEIVEIGTALAILLTLVVTVTLPPSFKGLGAAAFTGELYPEQNKTLHIRISEDDTATPMKGAHFPPSFWPTRAPKEHFLSPLFRKRDGFPSGDSPRQGRNNGDLGKLFLPF